MAATVGYYDPIVEMLDDGPWAMATTPGYYEPKYDLDYEAGFRDGRVVGRTLGHGEGRMRGERDGVLVGIELGADDARRAGFRAGFAVGPQDRGFALGLREGVERGRVQGHGEGAMRAARDAFLNGLVEGQADGRRGGLGEGLSSAPAGDSTAPTITIVSPTPGVAIGEPGGFPRRYRDARETPIVLNITDTNPGIQFVVIIARFYADAEDTNPDEEVVYRRGQFRGKYVRGSEQEAITGGAQLTILRAGGWPSSRTGELAHIVFAVDALDSGGNLT